jgi:FkbM family methyltransferase
VFGNHTLSGRMVRLPLRLVPPWLTVRILRGRLRGWKWVAGSSTAGVWLGTYEQDGQSAIAGLLRPGMVFYDVGAHVGEYALLGSSLVGDAGRVIAFEPLPRNAGLLEKHVRINGLGNVAIIRAAVSDHPGQAKFKELPYTSMARIREDGGLTVDVVALDDLVSRCIIPPPDVIKIDVERAELSALRGAEKVLADKHPAILVSCHDGALHRSCRDFLTSLGYTCRPKDADLNDAADVLATKC